VACDARLILLIGLIDVPQLHEPRQDIAGYGNRLRASQRHIGQRKSYARPFRACTNEGVSRFFGPAVTAPYAPYIPDPTEKVGLVTA